MSIEKGTLYIVATPLGNLGDLSPRAADVLRQADLIAAEDTRHSARLLQSFDIKTSCISLHEHNEARICSDLVRRLEDGESIALISDAGTPLLSDPGYRLVRAAHDAGCRVVPVPGPSAISAALSVAGLPTDRFVFEGFLPAKSTARRQKLQALARETGTLVFFEAPHRLAASLDDMCNIFGGEREATLARELTKLYETVRHDSLASLADWVAREPEQHRGESVILIRGYEAAADVLDEAAMRMVQILLDYLPLKTAAEAAARISGQSKNALYRHALTLKQGDPPGEG